MLGNRLLPVVFLGGILISAIPAAADIYRYIDENGVCHFTNVKIDSRYTLFIRSPRKPATIDRFQHYEGIIRDASRRYGVETALIRALIKTESDFDPRAVSRSGAKGLMQLMPETAEDMGVKEPFDPRENIFGGTRYLGLLLQRFKHDQELALAAYNAGPESVETSRAVPPIPETKDFVAKVMNYYRRYSSAAR
jgi:soluble lytic murein transglycosylase